MRVVFAVILLALLTPAEAQEFIGLTEKKVKEVMAADKPEMSIDLLVKNGAFRYLKYRSRDDNETWLIFLNEEGRCNGVRITCNDGGYDRKLGELNDMYRPGEENRWSYMTDGNEINIILKRESLFFTVTYELTKQKG